MALQCFLSTLSKESIMDAFKLALRITGYIELGPRNSYFKVEGRGFSSTLGAFALSNKGLFSSFNGSTSAREAELVERHPEVEHTWLLRDFHP